MSQTAGSSVPQIDAARIRRMLRQYRITDGKGFRLRDHDPADTAGHVIDRPDATALLNYGIRRLAELQELLYAQKRWAVLCVLQAMDTAGKDGTIKHVLSGVNPQGVHVTSFKAPGQEELSHDFLWRVNRALPPRGQIGIFNRSHYEEVLVCRVHPEVLERQNLPDAVRGRHFWRHRLEAIAGFEQYLARQGFAVVKFFLHISKDEQKRRLIDRLDDRSKHWKFDRNDLIERGFWDQYQDAYEEAIAATAAPHAPWYVVPGNNKWFSRLVVAAALVHAMEKLDLHYPRVTETQERELQEARAALAAEG